MIEVNNRIQEGYKSTQSEAIIPIITLKDLQPKPLEIPADGTGPKAAKIQGLHGVAMGMVARAMSERDSLKLSDDDRQKLKDIADRNDATIVPHDEAAILLEQHSALKKMKGLQAPKDLLYALKISINNSLETYFTNKPLRNDPPPASSAQR